MIEAGRKRELALDAAGGRLVISRPADVRWLLCVRAPTGLPRPAIIEL
jgi:hypothetical protein